MRSTITSVVFAALLLAARQAHAADPAVEAAARRAVAAGAPAVAVERIVARGAARGLPPTALAGALGAVERAAARGLPIDGVADKALEGIAKGVPSERLVPVLDEMVGRLAEADRALARIPASLASRQQLVEEGADALRRGADRAALESLAAEASAEAEPRHLSLAIRELGELGEHGAATPMAGVALGRMVSRGYAAGALDELSDRVRDALAEGAEPAEVLEEIALRADSGRPMERLVDPFAERPGSVLHDPAARGRPALPGAAQGRGVQGHPLGGPPGRSGLDRPGNPNAPGQKKRLDDASGGTPGRGNGKGNGQGNKGNNGKGPRK